MATLVIGCHAGMRMGATTGRTSSGANGSDTLSVSDEHYDVFGEVGLADARVAFGLGGGIGLHDISRRTDAMTR